MRIFRGMESEISRKIRERVLIPCCSVRVSEERLVRSDKSRFHLPLIESIGTSVKIFHPPVLLLLCLGDERIGTKVREV
jgi:hypothetical protein